MNPTTTQILAESGQYVVYVTIIFVLGRFIKNMMDSHKKENHDRIEKMEDHILKSEKKYDKHMAECDRKHEESNKIIQQIYETQIERKDEDIKLLCDSVNKLCTKLDKSQ